MCLCHTRFFWILRKVENLVSSRLQDKAKDWLFLVCYQAQAKLSIQLNLYIRVWPSQLSLFIHCSQSICLHIIAMVVCAPHTGICQCKLSPTWGSHTGNIHHTSPAHHLLSFMISMKSSQSVENHQPCLQKFEWSSKGIPNVKNECFGILT